MKILRAATLLRCNATHTPMEQHLELSKSSTAPAIDPSEYRRIIGAHHYLVNTRPDLAYIVGYVSRFMEEQTTEHLLVVKRVLCYVARIVHHGCFYKKKGEKLRLIGYCDSDLAGDVDTQKSTNRVLYFLSDNLMSWQSQKRRAVALSSCEVEYIAIATTSGQGMWLGRLLIEIKGEEIDSVTLKIDSLSVIQLSRNPILHDHSKHIDTNYHYIQHCIDEGRVQVEVVGTNNQLADILMKPLYRDRFMELRTRIGVINQQVIMPQGIFIDTFVKPCHVTILVRLVPSIACK
jgi:hypothetical protein